MCKLNGETAIIHSIVGLTKRHIIDVLYKTSQYFPKPYDCYGGNVKFKLDLSNYAKSADLKETADVNTYHLTTTLILFCS